MSKPWEKNYSAELEQGEGNSAKPWERRYSGESDESKKKRRAMDVASDLAKGLGGAAVSAVGAVPTALGRFVQEGGEKLGGLTMDEAKRLADAGGAPDKALEWYDKANRLNPISIVGRGIQAGGEFISKQGDALRDARSAEAKERARLSTPDGDLTKPSTWTMGEDPSVEGVLQVGADVMGSMAPPIATAVATRGRSAATQMRAGGAVVGGQIGGSAIGEAGDYLGNFSDEQLRQASPVFLELEGKGYSAADARAMVQRKAENTAATFAAPVGYVGGKATAALLGKPGEKLAGAMGSTFAKAGVLAALGATEEGLQEVAEGVATRAGINKAAGTDRSLTDGTFGEFVLGAKGGGTMGAGKGVLEGLRGGRDQAPAVDPDPLLVAPSAPATPGAPVTDSQAQSNSAAPPAAPAAPVAPAPAADPTVRLAELELTAGTRDLTEPERQEAAALFEQLQAAEDADNQGPADVQDPTQPPARAVGPEAQGAETPAPEGSDGAIAAGSSAEPGASGLEAAGVDPRENIMGQAIDAAQRVLQNGGTEADANRAATDALISGMDQAPDIEISQDAPAAVQAARDAVDSAPILPPLQAGPDVNLQNRDRGRAASVIQMTEIARNPDYMRLGPSRTPDSGAPMVFAVGDDTAAIPPENFGREDVAVMSDGQQVGFRYAVADATKVNPSNFADGRANEAFNSDLPGTIKALNNGRTAGVRAAHEMGTSGQYVQAMQGDAQMHGISPDVIARTPNPILVRVYADGDNTAGMAAKSQGQGLGMSPSELARQDAPLMDASVLGVYQPGDVTSAGNRDFVRAFVGKLQGSGQDVAAMMTGNGELSQDGRKRIQAALMQAAYGDADLVDEMFDSTDTDIKAIGEALKTVAGEWANMRDSARLGSINPDADVTENLLQTLGLIRKARRDRSALSDLVNQPDLLTGQTPDPITVSVLRMFYSGQYFTRAVGRDTLIKTLSDYVRGAMSTSAAPGMFGDDVNVAQLLDSLIIKTSGEQNAQTEPKNSGAAPAGGRPGGGDAAQGERAERGPIAAPRSPGPDRGGKAEPAKNPDQAGQQDGQGDQGGAQGEGEDNRGEVKRLDELEGKKPAAAPAPKPKAQKPAKSAPEPRAMNFDGRPVDGKPVMPGDTFRTTSGRITSPWPTQKGARYASQWSINNALMEAEARGDGFNLRQFQAIKPGKNGMLTTRDGAALAEYLFGEQPAVVPSILKPLTGRAGATPAPAPAPAEPEPSADDLAKAKAAEDLKSALGDLADIFGKDFKANMLPEQEQKLLPVLTRLMDAAFRLGYLSFKDAAKYALDQIRAALGAKIADEISLEHLQGAYIGMAGRYKEQGAESARAVVQIEDKAEIEKHTARVAKPKEKSDVPGANGRVERDSQEPGAEPAVGGTVPPGARPAADGARPTGGQAGGEGGSRQPGGAGVSAGGAVAGGNVGDFGLLGGKPPVGPALVTPGDQFGERGGDSGIVGIPADPIPAAQVDAAAQSGNEALTLEQRQRAAQKTPVKLGDIDNIRATLPYLLAGQQEDVAMAEAQFAKADGYGMLFTNGTGTGKTFSGLGIVKRLERQGKTNVLIVVPDEKIATDWIKSGKPLMLDITRLENTKSAGKGIVVTTYANLGANDELARRDWDLVLTDEAHSLMQSADGKMTAALANMRAITLHPDGAYTRHTMLNRDEIAKLADVSEQIDANDKILSNPDTMDVVVKSLRAENAKLNARRAALNMKLNDARDAIKANIEASQGLKRTRLAALSATPFAYDFTIDWANGYLFDYNEGRPSEKNTARGYNEGTNREQFFMQHFGYAMRTNKLTKPDPSKVDTGMMQRKFNTMLKKRGSLAGRMLDVDADYDRRFVLVDSAIGNEIDAALEWVNEQARGAAKGEGGMSMLRDILADQFDYLSRRYLLEAIKATEAVAIVKQHLAMGRKVVVFHDYNKGGGFNPFDLLPMGEAQALPGDDGQTGADLAQRRRQYNAAVAEFRAKFKNLAGAPFRTMASPIEVFKREFPNVLLINGKEKAGDLLKRYDLFQDDASGPLVALVQSQKNKGWSGHDTTGKNQRVLINLGQPTAPTLAIQQEGRIYRTGQVTDAIMRYLNTGTNWEKWAFATTIAGRSGTAENLGMGELARALKDSFIAAFEESDAYPPGHEGEGKGGKERDRAANNVMTEWDRAKAYYWATQKKNARTKAQEGVDYFATPEPVGLKMVEFLGLRGGEDTLEPSAGHGAIARWLPDNTNRTAIEPSNALRARLAMVMDTKNDRIIDDIFENHAIVNKYDGIPMNPPFGKGGKTAIEHVAKAAGHLRDGGRIVALIPTGPAADKRFNRWMYEKAERAVKPIGETTINGKVVPLYRGDKLTIGAFGKTSAMELYTIVQPGGSGAKYARAKGADLASAINLGVGAVTSVESTGPRTEEYSPTANLYLVADIQLPGVTFERAGTGVMTRIVVIEKQMDASRAPTQRNHDLSDIEDINALFDRLESMNLPERRKTAAQESRASEEKAAEEAAAKKEDAKTDKAGKGEKPGKAIKPGKAAPAEVGSTVTMGGKTYTVEAYVTNGGKEIRGVWMATKAAALSYGPWTFEKRGKGFFVRERDFKTDRDTTLSIDAEHKRADTSTYGTATQVHKDHAARLNAGFAKRVDGGSNQNLLDAVAPGDTGTGRAAKAVRALARRLFGREVVFVKFTGKPLFNGAVSSFAPGVIFINIDSQRPYMTVLGHELLHEMAKSQPDVYRVLSETLDKYIKDEMTYALRTVAAYKAAGIDLKGLDTREELEADIMGDAFLDPKFWDMIATGQPGLFKRLAASVMQWLDDVAAKIGVQRPFGTEEFLTDVAAARNAVAQAVRQFSANEVGAVTDPTNGPDADVSMSVASQGQTDTPAFKRWFGDSKVVDAQGKPLVVYHGSTRGGIRNANVRSTFFTSSQDVARTYSQDDYSGSKGSAPVVQGTYLKMLNPLEVDARGEEWMRVVFEGRKYTTDDLAGEAKRRGYDGLVVRNVIDNVSDEDLPPADIYVTLGKQGQIKSATDNNGDFDPENASITLSIFGNPARQPGQPNAWQKLKARVNTLTSRESLDRLVYEYQDKLVDLKRIREHIKAIGGTITDLNDAYLGEELYHKRVAKRTHDFLADEIKPLLADMRLRGVDMPTLEQYLHARHAPEANKAMADRNPNQMTIDTNRVGADAQVRALERLLQKATAAASSTKALTQALDQAREERARWVGAQAFKGTEAERLSLSGMSDQDAAAIIAVLSPRKLVDLNALASKVDAINNKTVNTLEAYGLMDSASLSAWRKAYKFYVPLHRDEAHPDGSSHPIGQGFSTKGAASKQRTGSNAKVTNILGHIALQREAALTRGEKNMVAKKLYLMVAQNPDPALWAVDKPPMVKTIDKDTGLVRSNIDPTYKNKPNVLMVRISGKDAAIVFNEKNPNGLRLVESMKNLDVGDLDAFSNIMAKGTRWLASVNTQYNPVFGLVNFTRDIQAAALQLSSTPIAGAERQVLADTPKALAAIYRQVRGGRSTGPWATLWQELQNEGGTTGYRELFIKPDDRVKALESELKALDRGQASKAAHAVVDWLSDFNEAIENGVRLATYKAALDRGLSKPRAASLAKNITVNFNRRGRQTAKLGAYYAFLNAAIQGTTRMVEALKGPAGKKIMLGGVMLGALNTLLGIAIMGAGDDDEEEDNWEKIPDFVKERNVIIPLGREDYLTIPMPLGFNVLPNIGRKAVEMMLHDDPTEGRGKHVGELALIVMDSFNPFGGSENLGQLAAPTVFDPAIGLMQNRDWTGRKIYRADQSSLDPTPGFTRTKDSASSFSKGVAEAINFITGGNEYKPGAISWTPDQIDYVVGQLTGGVGRELMKLEQTLTAPFTGEDLPSYKIPIVGRLYGNTSGPTQHSEKFYENVRRLNMVENELKGRAHDDNDLDGYLEKEPLAPLVGAGNAAESQLRKLRAARRAIIAQGTDGYLDEVKEINTLQGQVMKDLNRQVREAKQAAQN